MTTSAKLVLEITENFDKFLTTIFNRQQYCQYRDDFNSYSYVHQIYEFTDIISTVICDGLVPGVRGDIT